MTDSGYNHTTHPIGSANIVAQQKFILKYLHWWAERKGINALSSIHEAKNRKSEINLRKTLMIIKAANNRSVKETLIYFSVGSLGKKQIHISK